MLRILATLYTLITLSSYAYAGVNNITEGDDSPSVYPWKIKFANGSVTDNADGTVSIAAGAGLSSPVTIAEGGTGQTSRQAAIDALTDVSATTTGYVLTKDGSGNATFQANTSSLFTDSTTTTYLTTTGDDFVVGTTAPVNSGKLTVLSTDDQATIVAKMASGQTANALEIKNNSDTNVLTVSTTGSITAGSGSGTLTQVGTIAVNNGATSSGTLSIFEDSDAGSNKATFQVPSLAADTAYTLPADDGDADQVLSTNGSGTLDWVTASGSKPPKEYTWPASATLPLEAADSIPPIAKDTGTNIDMLVVDFDDSTDEGRSVTFRVPSDINTSGTVTFRAYWYSAAATSGACVWDFRHNSGTAGDIDPDVALTTEAASADTTAGTAGMVNFTTWTETVSNLAWAANDLVVGVFYRDANAAGDTLVGDARAVQFDIDIPRT